MEFKESLEFAGVFTDHNTFQEYVSAGNGTVILTSPTGVRHVYGMRPVPDKKSAYFVSAKSDGNYRYLGMLFNNEGRWTLKTTKASKFENQSPEVKGAVYIANVLSSRKLFESTPMRISHYGVCGVCGRVLTNSNSIARGIGPVCYNKHC